MSAIHPSNLLDARALRNAVMNHLQSGACAGRIYRFYFLSAIVITLTLGATWGASLLWRIGGAGSFTGVGIQEVNAHGEAQLFGWVGLFIMGFAYQAFPRMWRSTLAAPRLAMLAWIMMLGGLILRTYGMIAAVLPLAMIGCGLELAAVVIFLMQMLITFERRLSPFEPYMGFIMVALAWFGLSTVFSSWHTWTTMNAASRQDLLFLVSTYQAALRDSQIHGVAMMMIFGISLKMLPAMFGVQRIDHRRAIIALLLLTTAIAGETSFFIAYRWTEAPELAGVVYAMWVLLFTGVAVLIGPWRFWEPLPIQDGRSAKFVRAAYLWLAISLTMLLALPLYQAISHLPFSHAYYGAIRHAITVGFISMMIMGMGAKVIPALSGVPKRSLGALWIPFVLVNLGCTLRVSLQPLTDAIPGTFRFLGISGTLEILGLAWWGIAMAHTMLRRNARPAIEVSSDVVQVNVESSQANELACCSACESQPTSTCHAHQQQQPNTAGRCSCGAAVLGANSPSDDNTR